MMSFAYRSTSYFICAPRLTRSALYIVGEPFENDQLRTKTSNRPYFMNYPMGHRGLPEGIMNADQRQLKSLKLAKISPAVVDLRFYFLLLKWIRG